MKRIALFAAFVTIAACAKKEEAKVDSAAMAPAPSAMAPAADAQKMADSLKADSIRKADSAKAADSAAKAPAKH